MGRRFAQPTMLAARSARVTNGPMDGVVFAAVLAAAALHAGWNAVIKVGLDRFSSVLLLAFVQSGLSLALLPFVPVPASAAWPWLAVAALLHTGYKLFLIRAYEHGDLGQVYPLARGTAPLLVAVMGSLVFGERIGATGAIAVAAIASGVMLMALKGGQARTLKAETLGYALATAAFTASYTLADANGARLAATASGFALWMFVGDGLGMLVYALVARGPRALSGVLPAWKSGVAAGAMSLGSYWIAIWAFTKAHVALVAALRETSVLFAMLISTFVLRERSGVWCWISAALLLAGVVAIRF